MRGARLTRVFMDTAVTVEVVQPDDGQPSAEACGEAIGRAFMWFAEVESACSRFDARSELRRLTLSPGRPVPVSPLLFQAVDFALTVAESSGGAFDPTVGGPMASRGFDRDYRTGDRHCPGVTADADASWRDVLTDPEARTITLTRPLLLDLGAVAKGLAADLAMRELEGFPGSAVEAGGDVAVRGVNRQGQPWRIGIRHPRQPGALCAILRLSDAAVCTSGDYERRSPTDGGSHLLDPRSGRPAQALASCSVVGPSAMLADTLSTAAGILGPAQAIPWLQGHGVEALLVTPDLQRYTTAGFARLAQCR